MKEKEKRALWNIKKEKWYCNNIYYTLLKIFDKYENERNEINVGPLRNMEKALLKKYTVVSRVKHGNAAMRMLFFMQILQMNDKYKQTKIPSNDIIWHFSGQKSKYGYNYNQLYECAVVGKYPKGKDIAFVEKKGSKKKTSDTEEKVRVPYRVIEIDKEYLLSTLESYICKKFIVFWCGSKEDANVSPAENKRGETIRERYSEIILALGLYEMFLGEFVMKLEWSPEIAKRQQQKLQFFKKRLESDGGMTGELRKEALRFLEKAYSERVIAERETIFTHYIHYLAMLRVVVVIEAINNSHSYCGYCNMPKIAIGEGWIGKKQNIDLEDVPNVNIQAKAAEMVKEVWENGLLGTELLSSSAPLIKDVNVYFEKMKLAFSTSRNEKAKEEYNRMAHKLAEHFFRI